MKESKNKLKKSFETVNAICTNIKTWITKGWSQQPPGTFLWWIWHCVALTYWILTLVHIYDAKAKLGSRLTSCQLLVNFTAVDGSQFLRLLNTAAGLMSYSVWNPTLDSESQLCVNLEKKIYRQLACYWWDREIGNVFSHSPSWRLSFDLGICGTISEKCSKTMKHKRLTNKKLQEHQLCYFIFKWHIEDLQITICNSIVTKKLAICFIVLDNWQ